VNAFYTLVQKWYAKKEYTSILMTKTNYEEHIKFLCSLKEGGDCKQTFLAGNTNAYKWAWKYHVFTVGVESAVLVIHPKKFDAIDVTAMALSSLQQPSFAERLFIDLCKIHKENHCKGITYFYHVRDKHGNVIRDLCKMYTDVCPQCIRILSHQSHMQV
jgi:hypothetical protein